MSITVDQSLPDAPVAGNLIYVPLGGDGLSAPHAAWQVNTHAIADDSGGVLTINCTMDDRFVSLVPWVLMEATQTTPADVEALLNIGHLAQRFDLLSIADATAGGANHATVFKPPPLLLPGGTSQVLKFRTANVDNTTWKLKSYILLFRIDVREKYPLGPLLFASGST